MKLSKHQIKVLRLFCSNMSVNAIAIALGLSPKTIEWHMAKIRNYFRAQNDTTIAFGAIREGIISYERRKLV